MRRIALVAALLSLAACNNKQQSAEANSVDQNLESETIGGNDVTAIDAATGEDANMAADSDVVLNESLSNEAGDNEATDEGATTNEE
jgi:hypothetical protein